MARIEAAGGRVIYVNGARVLGILAMSRAIGKNININNEKFKSLIDKVADLRR